MIKVELRTFRDPEYASYVALCRELKLPREWQPGDWYFVRWIGKPPLIKAKAGEPYEYGPVPVDEHIGMVGPQLFPRPVDDAESAWLPSLTDWAALLIQAGQRDLHIGERRPGDAYAAGWTEEKGNIVGDAPTFEEAAARLWLAVR